MAGRTVHLAHGSGGTFTRDLVRSVFLRYLGNEMLDRQDDAAVWIHTTPSPAKMALTTDSYVVSPIFFPGGDLGKLAVCGTVNDLAMMGATPLYLTAGFVIEEGLPMEDLERIVLSMAETAKAALVSIVAGDTKVVEKGSADRLFVNTSGVGCARMDVSVSGANGRPGDSVILSGSVGEHGLAVMSLREGLSFPSSLKSDCAPLNGLVSRMLEACPDIHALRDPTRGGVATALNELAVQSGVGMEIEERAIPVAEPVRSACELLGLDPLYAANEGKLIALVPAHGEKGVLEAMRSHEYGARSVAIGRVTDAHPGRVVLRTAYGGKRVLDMLSGAQLPRIC